MSRYFVITGESSGDKLAALLCSELISQNHEIQGWGGTSMRKAGVSIVQDISALKIMGWTDVIIQISNLISLFSQCKRDIKKFRPDALILVDFGSFNLRIAKWAKGAGYKIIYYSPPKIWASRSSRIDQLRKYVDLTIVLFPFEKEYYDAKGLNVDYFGHPIANKIKDHQKDLTFKKRYFLDARPILAILPGSRKSEIKKTLGVYLSALENDHLHQICISCSNGMRKTIDAILFNSSIKATVIEKDYFNLLAYAESALVTSGTANLETALFKVPQVVGYKTNWLNYRIAKLIIQSSFISLVNLNLNKEVVKELIQGDLTSKNLRENLIRLKSQESKSQFVKEHEYLSKILTIDNCVKNTAAAITARVKKL